MPSSVTVDVQTGRSSAVRRETSSPAPWLIPASASVTSTARDTGSKRGLGAGPRSVPGSTTATSSMKRIPNRTSRTWSQDSAIDHMAGSAADQARRPPVHQPPWTSAQAARRWLRPRHRRSSSRRRSRIHRSAPSPQPQPPTTRRRRVSAAGGRCPSADSRVASGARSRRAACGANWLDPGAPMLNQT
jgi:hypothetical protein